MKGSPSEGKPGEQDLLTLGIAADHGGFEFEQKTFTMKRKLLLMFHYR